MQIITIFSVFLAAFLQWYFTKLLSTRNHNRDNEAKACADFLTNLLRLPALNPTPDQDAMRQSAQIEASARLCIYGRYEIVSALHNYNSLRGSDKAIGAFYDLISVMRKANLGGKQRNIDALIRDIIKPQ
jgi:hypothetical protein